MQICEPVPNNHHLTMHHFKVLICALVVHRASSFLPVREQGQALSSDENLVISRRSMLGGLLTIGPFMVGARPALAMPKPPSGARETKDKAVSSSKDTTITHRVEFRVRIAGTTSAVEVRPRTPFHTKLADNATCVNNRGHKLRP